jgi:hypothetical protein
LIFLLAASAECGPDIYQKANISQVQYVRDQAFCSNYANGANHTRT